MCKLADEAHADLRAQLMATGLPAWENLVRAAYRDYNASIVGATLKGK